MGAVLGGVVGGMEELSVTKWTNKLGKLMSYPGAGSEKSRRSIHSS
jgi:hypothetical protein